MSSTPLRLSAVGLFKQLPAEDLALLEAHLEPLPVRRGVELVRQGDAADALYVVISGRFSVEVEERLEPIAEISSGSPIGEIAFFAGGTRTATVRAIRDSVVVKLTRSDFDAISQRSPAIWQAITAKLAERLAAETRKTIQLQNKPAPKPRPRTLALVRAGEKPIPAPFLSAFETAARSRPGTLLITPQTLTDHVSSGAIETLDATRIFNELEGQYETIIFIAGNDLTPWSEKAIRQADEVLLVGTQDESPPGTDIPPNALENFLFSLDRKPRCRLVIVHPTAGAVQGTRHWLHPRNVEMHHHAALGSTADIERLWRFIKGEALGFVACGGGAYCAAHIGVYKAFGEKGIDFDCVGGTSGGAAMAAAFAQNVPAAEIDARVHRMFIEGKALSRYTLPRYSLLDHTHFDSHLAREYGDVRIEDLWKPYFAVSMDLSDYAVEVHRTGPVWEAIRASASIPALLPPFYTNDGRMLVDGSVVSNVPIDIMHQLKSGPNVVVSFNPPAGERFAVDYKSLPARRELLLRTMNPFARRGLPKAPSAATVLVRSLMSNHNHFERQLESGDWLLVPPTDANMGALDWRRHTELVETSYRYALGQIASREK
jgi:NTE family protein